MKHPRTLTGFKERIEGDRIYLRTLEREDASSEYASWLNDPMVNQYLETRSITLEKLRAYIEEKDQSPSVLFFGIFWKENGKHIGNVKLEPIDFEKGCATMGILIGDKDYWGWGVGTETTNLVTDYALKNLSLREVNLGVMADNTAAIRVYEKCGYTIDHVEKKSIKHQ